MPGCSSLRSTEYGIVENRPGADWRSERDPGGPGSGRLADTQGHRAEGRAATDIARYAVEISIRHRIDTIVHMTSLYPESAIQRLVRDRQDVSDPPENITLRGPVLTCAY